MAIAVSAEAGLEWVVLKNDLKGDIRPTEAVETQSVDVSGDYEHTDKYAKQVVDPLRGEYDEHQLDTIMVAINEGLINGAEHVLNMDPERSFQMQWHLLKGLDDYLLVSMNYGGEGFDLSNLSIQAPQRWHEENGQKVALKRKAGHGIMGEFSCMLAYDNSGKDLYMLFPLTKKK